MAKNTNGVTIPKPEGGKAFGWFHATSVNGTAMIMAASMSSFLSPYLTDTLGIAAKSASLIMLIASLWDAINDPIMGVLADRTRSKLGRYRPYFLPAPILLTIFATLIWVDWGFSAQMKWLYVLLMYIGYGMTVTMYTMPQMAILPAVVRDNTRRNQIITMGAGACAIAFTIGSSFTTNITGFFNKIGFSNGYVPFFLILGLLSCISFWGLFRVTKGQEKYLTPIKKDENPLSGLGIVFKHKEIWPNIIAWVMASVGYGLMFASSVYYMMYYYMRPDLITIYMLVISIGALVSMVVLMPIFLKIFKTGQKAIMISQILSMICYIFLFIFGRGSFPVLCVVTFISTCTSSMQNALVNVLVNDFIDFVQLKDGVSANGLVASVKGFAQKCGNTLTNSGILFILGVAGYVPNAIGGQPESAMFALNFIKFGAPTLTGLVLILCVFFNPIAKYYPEIEAMKAKMHANAAEDEATQEA